MDMTDAKQSLVDHACGSRLPSSTILHFVRVGLPFSLYLMVDDAIVGRALPTMCRIFRCSVSVMDVHVGRLYSP